MRCTTIPPPYRTQTSLARTTHESHPITEDEPEAFLNQVEWPTNGLSSIGCHSLDFPFRFDSLPDSLVQTSFAILVSNVAI